tara:strand:- start:46 stop:708 length:663 start_codon:yes stop_codon:yes gene_type:complete
MKVLDLWAGTCSGTAAWARMGFEVVSVDNDPQFMPTICKDILDVTVEELEELGPFVFIWASPQCSLYSMANMRWETHFDPETKKPLSEAALLQTKRVKHTLYLIEQLRPTYWILENPRALLRTQPFMTPYQRCTVTYCQYGDDRMKPTDLWGRFPRDFIPKSCRNYASCHKSAPRGSRTGTQGMDPIEAGKIPFTLSRDLYEAAQTSNGESWATLDLWTV